MFYLEKINKSHAYGCVHGRHVPAGLTWAEIADFAGSPLTPKWSGIGKTVPLHLETNPAARAKEGYPHLAVPVAAGKIETAAILGAH